MINKDDFINSLEEFLLEEESSELGIKYNEEQESPIIDSPEKANFFLKLFKNIQLDIDNINELCDQEIKKNTERINKYREDQLKPLVRSLNNYKDLLKNYTEHNIVKSKTIKLPYGTLSLVKEKKYDYGDEKDLQEWLINNTPEFIKTVLENKIDKVKLKKNSEITAEGGLIANGKIIPGVKVEQKDNLRIK